MTALAHAYQHATSRMGFGGITVGRSLQFSRINKKHMVTVCLMTIMAAGALQYLGALYAVFALGLRAQSESRAVGAISQEVDALELETQRATASFPVEHKATLDAMEKISGVRYITGAPEAVSYAPAHP